MTATLVQGQRNEKLTANRSLERFLSPDRQRLLGFQEFPKHFNEVTINGKQAAGWDQDISDGDTVVIKLPSEQGPTPSIGIGVSSVAEAAVVAPSATQQQLNELQTKYNTLREAATRALAANGGLNGIRQDLATTLDRVNILFSKIQDIRQSLTVLENQISFIRDNVESSSMAMSTNIENLTGSLSS